MTWNSMTELKAANEKSNQYWFSPDTMKFFNSKVYNKLYEGRFFITGERQELEEPLQYTVRVAWDDASIDTVGTFQAYDDHDDAVSALHAALTLGSSVTPTKLDNPDPEHYVWELRLGGLLITTTTQANAEELRAQLGV